MLVRLGSALFALVLCTACSGGRTTAGSGSGAPGASDGTADDGGGADEASTQSAGATMGADTSAATGDHPIPEASSTSEDGPDVPCWMKVDRRFGATRIETAVEISKKLFPGQANAAVVISSALSPDGITAGPIAQRFGGPVLLSASATLSPATRAELERIDPSTVYVIGGTASLSVEVETEISSLGVQVQRIAGANRYETNADGAQLVGSPSKLAFVASGVDEHLTDGFLASSTAGGLGVPVLLVNAQGIPTETQNALSSLEITHTYVVGGIVSIPDVVAEQLPNHVRLAGPTRFDTAVEVGLAAIDEGLDATHVFIVNAMLDDAPALGAAPHPLLLSEVEELHSTSASFLAQYCTTTTLVGGLGTLTATVENQACAALP